MTTQTVLQARGLSKRYGHVVAMADCDFDLRAGEILGVIGDNGAGKSTLIKALTGALVPDTGVIHLNGEPVSFRNPLEARRAGIETVYQELGVAPALEVSQNLFLGREQRRPGLRGSLFRQLDKPAMRRASAEHMADLGIRIQSIRQRVETLSGGQRQAVAVARVAAWATRLVVMDEPTAALGVRETHQVLDLILRVRDRGLPVVLISHDMPNVFQVADRIHIHRLGRRVALVNTGDVTMDDAVAVMTGARSPADVPQVQVSTPDEDASSPKGTDHGER
ncbi:MAG: sugar ABC transporter ATP-binding protein [Cellulomonas sp.]|uniref:ATP-binding cassette domain-containing protein n=1 Tax=Cellulomonas sp. 73-92 TaxID=1895740 RepID=UPI00092A763F|nr:ATP-binding cassette domain-containing protein [Cellulomonas sp. 73-92]MBN9375757.1 sugar ABC transporter ATP-binding protein [Cellulomonas sp.]OJV83003.1 MAG: sugar ABC transporter ATP-binding protein [Cellulomonas sp. 73-92]